MGKLIDVDDLFKGETCGYTHWDYIKKKCGSIPEAVVRCKDCGSYDTDWESVGVGSGFYYCSLHDCFMRRNDFCSDGERRE